MNRINIKDEFFPDCPVRNVLSRISDKWSMLVIFTLNNSESMRFNSIQKSIPDISQKMLTVTLRTLAEDGFVNRKVFAEVPPRVEYSLTERALSLIPHVAALVQWAKENMGSILADREHNANKK